MTIGSNTIQIILEKEKERVWINTEFLQYKSLKKLPKCKRTRSSKHDSSLKRIFIYGMVYLGKSMSQIAKVMKVNHTTVMHHMRHITKEEMMEGMEYALSIQRRENRKKLWYGGKKDDMLQNGQ